MLFAMVSKTVAVLTFPSASLTCPQMTSLCGNFVYKQIYKYLVDFQLLLFFVNIGHSYAINEIRHIPGTLFYVSLDISKVLLISDIRNGEVY